jgi:YfiH family protein
LSAVTHGFSTRQDGIAFLAAAGLGRHRAALPRQVHGAELVRVGLAAPGDSPPAADGVFSLRGDPVDLAPAVQVADCVPLLLADVEGGAVAAVHAGWRGTAAGIAGRAVATLSAHGIEPGRLVAALGPSIGPCCYEVGAEVLAAVSAATAVSPHALAEAGRSLDLRLANRLQLMAAGLDPRRIHAAPWCTSCHAELFHSWRRDGDRAGRLLACIGWAVP